MCGLFELRFAAEKDYETLKALWKTAFDDSDEALERFFSKAVTENNALALFEGEKAVSMLYILDGHICADCRTYSAAYIYAVCTLPEYRGKGLMKRLFQELFLIAEKRGIEYLFLVPEEEYLFGVYEGLGFKNGFYYSEEYFERNAFPEIQKGTDAQCQWSYNKYSKIVSEKCTSVPVAFLTGGAFECFVSVNNTQSVCRFSDDWYFVCDVTDNCATVYEWSADKESVVREAFAVTNAEKLCLRNLSAPSDKNILYGMYKNLNGAPELENGFFGVPYSG